MELNQDVAGQQAAFVRYGDVVLNSEASAKPRRALTFSLDWIMKNVFILLVNWFHQTEGRPTEEAIQSPSYRWI